MRWDVHYVEQTGSTNSDLLALSRAGAPPGTVVWAGHQTAGRGRLGRSWEAPAGGCLLASILLEAEPVPFLVVARVALAASDACARLAGVAPDLKWPNDLLLGERKLAGLLAEADDGHPGVVVGIGCNLTWSPPGAGGSEPPDDLRQAAAALSDVAASVPDAARLLEGLLEELDGWLVKPQGEVLAACRGRSATLGRRVRVILADRVLEGTATGITPSGELEVACAGGSEVVRAGDVVHLRAT